jgi:signal recognition particle protein
MQLYSRPKTRPTTVINGKSLKSVTQIRAKTEATSGAEVKEVEKVNGVRICQSRVGNPILQFLVKLKDNDNENIWIPAKNVSEDIRKEFNRTWWRICKEGNEKELQKYLALGGETLIYTQDMNLRSALHFASGIGSTSSVKAIIESGAEIDSEDKDGYTPLHIASGYLHQEVVKILLEAGADPELQDYSGRSALDLVDMLKANTPATTVMYSRRRALEDVAQCLESFVYEEVLPLSLQASRVSTDGIIEYLVEWPDDYESFWVSEKQVADDLISDFQQGLSSEPFQRVLASRKSEKKGKEYLVQWQDSDIPSWESDMTNFNFRE